MTTEEVDSQNGQNEYNFLVVGPIGAGKSTFCNLITGDEKCKVFEDPWDNFAICTQSAECVQVGAENATWKFIDTPGTGNPNRYSEGRWKSEKDEIHLLKQFQSGFQASTTIDAILLCIKAGQRFTEDVAETIRMLHTFSAGLKHVIVVFTSAGCTEEAKEKEKRVQLLNKLNDPIQLPISLKNLIDNVEKRIILVEGKSQDPSEEYRMRKIKELRNYVQEMKKKGFSPFKNEEFIKQKEEYEKLKAELKEKERERDEALEELKQLKQQIEEDKRKQSDYSIPTIVGGAAAIGGVIGLLVGFGGPGIGLCVGAVGGVVVGAIIVAAPVSSIAACVTSAAVGVASSVAVGVVSSATENFNDIFGPRKKKTE